eukprot:CAMPEP_0194535422 /NCGR_PEP_ID=MMETSP0253-20130528/73944_1 /TAXON_ID=2966 /ORGANISM="Noctiluca scintillans" /LENGTH=102 /DNA_ID=CAMNT_0039381195 /DNA_START=51 /DNA_END=356 /DNA_ORIENTATION=+
MNGDDVDDWETTGFDPRKGKDVFWSVDVDEYGVAHWENYVPEEPVDGDEFWIQGTHTDWEPDPMERHATIMGLWSAHIVIGEEGCAEFQILSDGDITKVYYP